MGKHLSYGDREVLLKFVLISLPVYWFMVYKLPRIVIIIMEVKCQALLSNEAEKDKKNLVVWNDLCKPKEEEE